MLALDTCRDQLDVPSALSHRKQLRFPELVWLKISLAMLEINLSL